MNDNMTHAKAMTILEQRKARKGMTNIELKREAIAAFRNEYGTAPRQKEVTLLEASADGQYILFRVNEHEYSWDSITMEKRS